MGPLHLSYAFATSREHRNIVQLCATVYHDMLGWSVLRILRRWPDDSDDYCYHQDDFDEGNIDDDDIYNDDADKNGEDDDDCSDGHQMISIENIWRDHCWLRLRSSPWAHLSSSWDDGMMNTLINNGFGPLTISFSGR